jgi:hypothetical protein
MTNDDHNMKDIMDPQATQERAEKTHEANQWTKAGSYYRNKVKQSHYRPG